MNSLLRLLATALVVLSLAACVQSPPASDILDEVGANGLLTPRAILARYVDAVGGEEIIRSHSSTLLRGRFELSAFGIEGDIEIYSRAPDHVAQNIELSGLGSIHNGYNGEVGWNVDPLQGTSLLEGDALADLIQQSDYYLPLSLGQAVEQETEEVTQVYGNDAYKVRLTDERGKDSVLYFSTEDGLLLRSDTVATTPLGEIPTSTMLLDYRNFAGYLQPTSIVVNQAGQEFSIEVTEIVFDTATDADFEPPAAVRSLLN